MISEQELAAQMGLAVEPFWAYVNALSPGTPASGTLHRMVVRDGVPMLSCRLSMSKFSGHGTAFTWQQITIIAVDDHVNPPLPYCSTCKWHAAAESARWE